MKVKQEPKEYKRTVQLTFNSFAEQSTFLDVLESCVNSDLDEYSGEHSDRMHEMARSIHKQLAT